MIWQCNWKCWHLPWYSKSWDKDFKVHAKFAGIGPLQFHWWGK